MQKDQKCQPPDLDRFVADLMKGLVGVGVSSRNAADLARDLEVVLNPKQATPRQLRGCTRDFPHMLKVAGMKYDLADIVGADLKRIVPDPPGALPPDAPMHRYMFPVKDAPKFDRSVVVEDFEHGDEFFKIWYTPKDWSHGLVGVLDAVNKSSGRYGATIYNDVPPLQLSGTATVPHPFIDFRGMNALRMWIKPYGNDPAKCELQTGFIDGSQEIWQIDLPEALAAKEPFILQIRLEDFRRVLRRNNGIIDPECQNFGFWILGSFKFSVDDVMFVHDPSVPDFAAKANR